MTHVRRSQTGCGGLRWALWAPLPGPWLALLRDGWRLEWPRGSYHEVYSVLLWRSE